MARRKRHPKLPNGLAVLNIWAKDAINLTAFIPQLPNTLERVLSLPKPLPMLKPGMKATNCWQHARWKMRAKYKSKQACT